MAKEVVFYSLAPKPAARGVKAFEAAAEGRVARGRKWFRLECSPGDVYQFPNGTDEIAVLDWLAGNREAEVDSVAFMIDGVFYAVDNDAALDAVPGGAAARDHAVSLYNRGKGDGWVVFIPE